MAISRLTQTTLQNAFQKFNTVWDGTSAVSSMDAIGVVPLTATANDVTFSNIPQNYTHLQLRVFAKTGRTGANYSNGWIQFNGVTTTTYNYHTMEGDGRPYVSVGGEATVNGIYFARCAGIGSMNSNIFGFSIIDIADYTNTNKNKTTKTIHGYEACLGASSISGIPSINSGLWRSTAAITSIRIYSTDTPWQINSHFALYGIK